MKDIVIIGSGGYGREVAWLLEEINKVNKQWNILGYIESESDNIGEERYNYKVIGNLGFIKSGEMNVVCAIGDSKTRQIIVSKITNPEINFPNLIHPNVIVNESVEIGEGNVIFPNSIISTNVKIGNHNFLSLNTLISHDCVIEDFVSIFPGSKLSGNIIVQDESTIGTGTTIIQGKTIKKQSYIGAGSVVIRDVESKTIVAGVPAKVIKSIK